MYFYYNEYIFFIDIYNGKRKTYSLAILVLSVYNDCFIQVDFLGSTFFLFMGLQLSPTELIALLLNYYSSVLMPISQNDY